MADGFAKSHCLVSSDKSMKGRLRGKCRQKSMTSLRWRWGLIIQAGVFVILRGSKVYATFKALSGKALSGLANRRGRAGQRRTNVRCAAGERQRNDPAIQYYGA
jgi:hypothetical protein